MLKSDDLVCMSMGNKWTALAHLLQEQGKSDHRGKPRFVASDVACERGRLVDFSATGLKIRYSRCPKLQVGEIMNLELFSEMGQHNCTAEVVWTTKKGFRKHEVGYRFIDPESAKQMQLFRLGFDPVGDGMFTSERSSESSR
jgi:hypothetical protein